MDSSSHHVQHRDVYGTEQMLGLGLGLGLGLRLGWPAPSPSPSPGAEQKARVGANSTAANSATAANSTANFTRPAAAVAGTACFSLGSSRRGMFRTETDEHSNRC